MIFPQKVKFEALTKFEGLPVVAVNNTPNSTQPPRPIITLKLKYSEPFFAHKAIQMLDKLLKIVDLIFLTSIIIVEELAIHKKYQPDQIGDF